MSAITFLPVIEQPEKILCVGMNYAKKVMALIGTSTASFR